MPTISAVIKYATNIDELRRELKAGTDQLVVLEKAAERTVRNLGGEGLIRAAHNAAAAVQQLGGATKLTGAEQDRVNSLLTRAIDKYAALGQTAPAALHELAAATKRVEEPTSRLDGFLGDLGKSLVGTAAGFISAQAVIGGVQTAFRTLSGFVKDSVQSFANAEAAQKKLTTALQSTGNATPQVLKQFDEMATSFQRTTVYSDDLINEMQALLTEVGQVMPGQMNRALKASTDLASGLGIDLHNATMLVAKAFAGGGDELGRLKAILGDAYDASKGMEGALDAIEKKFGGQAQAEIGTYAGKVKQLANEWDNFKETVGGAIVLDPSVKFLLNFLTDVATKAGSQHRSTLAELIGLADQGLGSGITILEHFTKAANDAREAEEKLADAAIKSLPKVDADAFWRGLIPDRAVMLGIAGLKPLTDAQLDAMKAAEQHAKAIRELADVYAGAKAISTARDAIAAVNLNLRNGITIAQMSEEQQKALNKTVGDGLRAYEALGRVAPKAMKDIFVATMQLPPVVEGLGDVIEKLGGKFDIAALQADAMWAQLPKVTSGLGDVLGQIAKLDLGYQFERAKPSIADVQKSINELSRALSELAQVSGGAFGEIVSDLASMVGALNTVNKSLDAFREGKKAFSAADTLAGIASMTSGILGIASAALTAGKAVANLFDRNKGRDLVKDFAETFQTFNLDTMQFNPGGGFEELHNQLLELGAEGEKLWIALTQGVGRNNPEQARAVIDLITKALAGHKGALDDAATSATALGDAESEAVTKAKAAVADLDQQIASLNQSIANEAPEEEMGIIERNTRAQIASLEAQRAEAAKTLEDLTKEMTDSIHEVADAIDALPDEIALAIHATWSGEIPEPNGSAHVSTGGFVGPFGVIQDAQHFVRGGIARFVPRGTDTIPAMLSPGEGIASVRGMSILGRSGLAALNAGRIPDLPSTGTDGRGVTYVHNHYWQAVDESSVRNFIRRREFAEEFEREAVHNPNGIGSTIRQVAGS